MKISIEGPQGSGKTTVAKALMAHPCMAGHTYIKFDESHYITDKEISRNNTLIERGFLSESIYSFLWDSEIIVTVDGSFFRDMVTRKHIHDFTASRDHSFILFSSDPGLLEVRIKDRELLTGRKLSDLEWEVLYESNNLFEAHGKSLAREYKNAHLIDIAKNRAPFQEILDIVNS